MRRGDDIYHRLFFFGSSSFSPLFGATALALLAWFVMARIVNSRTGLQLMAVRTDEHNARVLGVQIGAPSVSLGPRR